MRPHHATRSPSCRTVIYRGGKQTFVPGLNGGKGYEVFAKGTNRFGHVVGSAWVPGADTRAFVYRGGDYSRLPRAFIRVGGKRYTLRALTKLGTRPIALSEPLVLSDRGQILVGGYDTTDPLYWKRRYYLLTPAAPTAAP
jgi:hypothetical protein